MYNYEKELYNLMRTVSYKSGIVKEIYTTDLSITQKNKLLGNAPRIFLSIAKINTDESGELYQGSSKSINRNKSIIKAIGESLERFCSVSNKDLLFKSVNELSKENIDYIHPDDIIEYLDNQFDDKEFGYQKYFDNDKLHWEKAINLNNNTEILIPAQKIYMKYPNYSEKYLDQRVTTGLACGSTYEQAVLSALYENIERDNFMISWLFKLKGRKIEYELNDIYNHELKNLLFLIESRMQESLHIIDISLIDNIYTIVTILENKNDNGISITVAAATDLNPEKAILKSLEELLCTNSYSYKVFENKLNNIYPNMCVNEISTLEDHMIYYFNPKNKKNIEFWLNNKKYINIKNLHNYSSTNNYENLKLCIKLLNKVNIDTYVCDITKEDVKMYGETVVKVINPGLVDLNTHKFTIKLGNKRIQKYLKQNTINLEPHPFP